MQKNTSNASTSLQRERRDTNCFIVFICVAVMFIIGLLYMTDANTLIASGVGIVISVIYNGIESLPFWSWTPTTPEIVASNVKLLMFVLFVISGIGALFSNRQNK